MARARSKIVMPLQMPEPGKAHRNVAPRVERYSFGDLHKMLFPKGPPTRRSLRELKEEAANYVRERHGRGLH